MNHGQMCVDYFLRALSHTHAQFDNTNLQPAAFQMNTTTNPGTIQQTFTLWKQKQNKNKITCSLASNTIALSFINPMLHGKNSG